jgi:hypothetical protein
MADRSELTRRRQANVPGGRRIRHPVKVTEEQEAQLQALAAVHGGISIPRLLVESTLSAGVLPDVDRRAVLEELFTIRRGLAGVANNVNQLTRMAHVEGIPNTDEIDAALRWLREMAGPGARLDEAIERVAGPRRVVR